MDVGYFQFSVFIVGVFESAGPVEEEDEDLLRGEIESLLRRAGVEDTRTKTKTMWGDD